MPALFICMLDAKRMRKLLLDRYQENSFKRETKNPSPKSTGVYVFYSDSAKVKAHMTTPLMIDHDGYRQNLPEKCPKGVKIIFYDDDLKEKGTITSDYAIRYEKQNTVTFRKNVVATNAQGETFKSEELIYDQNAKKIYSNKAVQINMANGNLMYGTKFVSNENMYPWTIDNSNGIFHVDEKQAQEGGR